jgi:hypothetical protein
LPDLERRAVTRFGLSFSEFWDSTPRELELLLEQSAYNTEMGMNRVRHIMVAVTNTVIDRKKKPRGISPKEVMRLPLIDGRDKTEEEYKSEQEYADDALLIFKARQKVKTKKKKK